MKWITMQTITITTASVALLWAVGCSKQSEPTELQRKQAMAKEETAEAMVAVGEAAEASKDAMAQDLKELSDKLKSKMTALKEKSGTEADELRMELKAKKAQVDQAMSDLADASAEQWKEVEQHTRDVMSDVQAWMQKHTD